jgi:hypothetical protein
MLVSSCTQNISKPSEPNISNKQIVEILTSQEKYNPEINPAEFTSKVTNKYFTLTPEKKMVYETGSEKVEVYVMNETKNIMGVDSIIVWDRVWLDGQLIEDTKDWYAQDKNGDVWYFGEDTKELVNNLVVSTKGSWKAGVNGAKPGIIMKANPQPGDTYRQEYYEGEAEDKSDILALGETVTLSFRKFTGCVKTLDYTPLEPDIKENKYYCPGAGGMVLEVDLENGKRVELVSVEYDAKPSSSISEVPEELIKLDEEKAKEIALEEVPGTVIDIAVERKSGKLVYVVEIDANSGPETDVIIDMDTGEVLGIET